MSLSENPFYFFALTYQILVKEIKRLIDLLKRINIAKMCESTDLNLNRIRNFMGGKIAHLTPEETKKIFEYCNHFILKGEK